MLRSKVFQAAVIVLFMIITIINTLRQNYLMAVIAFVIVVLFVIGFVIKNREE